jgi:hypothetical protein
MEMFDYSLDFFIFPATQLVLFSRYAVSYKCYIKQWLFVKDKFWKNI